MRAGRPDYSLTFGDHAAHLLYLSPRPAHGRLGARFDSYTATIGRLFLLPTYSSVLPRLLAVVTKERAGYDRGL